MSHIHVKRITPQEQFPLRERVLGQAPAFKDGDLAPETLHVGVYADDVLVSIASLYAETMPGDPSEADWRLRGMATLPEYERRGLGRLALERCLDYARAREGRVVWCNARENALPFYQRLGFHMRPDAYEVPGHGVRYFLWLPLR